MAGPAELWRKYKEYRVSKKRRRSSQTSSESSSRDSAVLDEAKILVVGLGLDMKQEEEECVGFAHEMDFRFVDNPTGIGCSRDYEAPHGSATCSPLSTSPASMRHHRVPQDISVNESDEHLPFSKLGPWKPTSFDTTKGKRKGREPGDSADDRYKFLLDRAASQAKFSSKRFRLVRVQA